MQGAIGSGCLARPGFWGLKRPRHALRAWSHFSRHRSQTAPWPRFSLPLRLREQGTETGRDVARSFHLSLPRGENRAPAGDDDLSVQGRRPVLCPQHPPMQTQLLCRLSPPERDPRWHSAQRPGGLSWPPRHGLGAPPGAALRSHPAPKRARGWAALGIAPTLGTMSPLSTEAEAAEATHRVLGWVGGTRSVPGAGQWPAAVFSVPSVVAVPRFRDMARWGGPEL